MVESRLLRAALEFCEQNAKVRAYKTLPKCEAYSKGDPSIGDGGEPWCLDGDNSDPETMCPGCLARFEGKSDYRVAINRRNKAKQRMIAEWKRKGDKR